MNWVQLAMAAAPIVAGLVAGRKGKKAADEAAGGARFSQLTPQMLALISQQIAQSNQNYGQQQERYAANQPLMDSIRSMAMGMVPTRYQQPMGGGGGQSRAMPTLPTMPAQAPITTGDILDDYSRRGGGTGGIGGGALKGASYGMMAGPIGMGVGALAGGITGAVQKHAKTAPTDFAVGDAENAISRALQAYQGRTANPGEVTEMLQGQGWQPGDRWVGDASMRYILNALQSQGR